MQLLEQLQGFVRKLSELGTAQASGKGDAKVLTEKRFIARQALKSQLYAISRTAAGLKLAGFWLSRDHALWWKRNEPDAGGIQR